MTLDLCLRITAIGLPLVGTLVLWRWGGQSSSVRSWQATSIFFAVGLIALFLFLFDQYSACTFRIGTGNCLAEGLGILFLIFSNGLLAIVNTLRRKQKKEPSYRLALFLSSALAGMALAKNLLVFLIFLNLLFYVLATWLEQRGASWGFLITRYDYRDDRDQYKDK